MNSHTFIITQNGRFNSKQLNPAPYLELHAKGKKKLQTLPHLIALHLTKLSLINPYALYYWRSNPPRPRHDILASICSHKV